ncbi:unnamed protein product [Merluccius merluccius]
MFGQTIKNFHINLNARDDRATYSGGDLVSGQVSFDLAKPSAINSVTLALKGRARVAWSTGSRKHRRHHSATVEYFNFKQVIMSKGDGEDVRITCEFSNASSRAATAKAHLVQSQVVYTLNRISSSTLTQRLASQAGDVVLPYSSDVHSELTLTLPSNLPFTISNCAIMDVSYLIEVNLSVKYSRDLTVLCPIDICDLLSYDVAPPPGVSYASRS